MRDESTRDGRYGYTLSSPGMESITRWFDTHVARERDCRLAVSFWSDPLVGVSVRLHERDAPTEAREEAGER